jgi:hypothetical protein
MGERVPKPGMDNPGIDGRPLMSISPKLVVIIGGKREVVVYVCVDCVIFVTCNITNAVTDDILNLGVELVDLSFCLVTCNTQSLVLGALGNRVVLVILF